MDRYYYFVAQLPVLAFNREAPVTESFFLEEAEKWLSPRDFSVLSHVSIGDIDKSSRRHRVADEYTAFEWALRRDLAAWRRAQKQNQDYKPSVFSAAVLKEGNPLEIETKLLQLRWDIIDDKIREHHFDLGYLILYFLQLQILNRLAKFDKEKGMEKFKQLYEVDNGPE
jgi:hypothetical protein